MFIHSCSFWSIVIDRQQIKEDILIVGDTMNSWRRKDGHFLLVEDLSDVWKYAPEVLIIGCGADSAMKISKTVVRKCSDEHIDLISCRTHDAVDEFNRISGQKKTACGLHLTC